MTGAAGCDGAVDDQYSMIGALGGCPGVLAYGATCNQTIAEAVPMVFGPGAAAAQCKKTRDLL